ncbi:MAG: succinate dehydrogenase [Planctomycetota bacterium]|nr:MAG: succinate dehydrogenase [Planctomycetota bacterium]
MQDGSLFGKYHFLIRRLHSLSGIIPVGVFLCMHLLTNASILAPGEPGSEFQRAVERIHALGPLLVPVEILFIFLPLLFHTLVGFLIVFTAESNVRYYRYGGNIRYTLQRTTGVIAFVFILYHVWQMHWMGKPFGGGMFEVHGEDGTPLSAVTAAKAIQSAWWVAPLYAVGIVASVFHFANGIWTALITWGITIKPRTQRAAGYVCTVFGVLLALIGLGALRGFRTFGETGAAAPGGGVVQAAEAEG